MKENIRNKRREESAKGEKGLRKSMERGKSGEKVITLWAIRYR